MRLDSSIKYIKYSECIKVYRESKVKYTKNKKYSVTTYTSSLNTSNAVVVGLRLLSRGIKLVSKKLTETKSSTVRRRPIKHCQTNICTRCHHVGLCDDSVPSSSASPSIHSPFQAFDSGPKSLDNIPDMPYLVELRLQLVNLPQYIPKTSDFSVGSGHRSASTRRLAESRDLCLSGELCRSIIRQPTFHQCAKTVH